MSESPQSTASPTIDPRDAAEVARELRVRAPGYLPAWIPTEQSPSSALMEIAARLIHAQIRRLNQVPATNKLAFLDMLGIERIAASSARVPMVFTLAANAADVRLPAGTLVAAPPPPDSTTQIYFETERSTGLAAGKLTQVFSLWPGRDQYIDHTADFLAGNSLRPFYRPLLRDIPHVLYIAHDTLLALAGKSTVDVTIQFAPPGSEQLDVFWEYWDGTTWREFLHMRPQCDVGPNQLANALNHDGTLGFTRSGTRRLQTDCAETAKKKVNELQSFWIRGRLVHTIPPDPARILPAIDSIRLGVQISRPLHVKIDAQCYPETSGEPVEERSLYVVVRDERETPLQRVTVVYQAPGEGDQSSVPVTRFTNSGGYVTFAAPTRGTRIEVRAGTLTGTYEIGEQECFALLFTIAVREGLLPDQALFDVTKLDVSKPFFPFGPQPQPGAAFYLTNEEAFTKPGARVQVYLQTAQSPQDLLASDANDTPASQVVNWEYWNGAKWASLSLPNPQPDLWRTTTFDFIVPKDIARCKVADQDGLWIRAQLINGSYGFTRTITWEVNEKTNSFTYFLPQPPSLAKLLIGYTWDISDVPKHVVTSNDFQYEDHTGDAMFGGTTFRPFRNSADITPSLYMGFDKKLPADRMGVFFDVREDRHETLGPAMVWEYWDGFAWQTLTTEDETRHLRVPGLLAFLAQADAKHLPRFGAPPLHWVRGRLLEDGPPGEPVIDGIYSNAAWAQQQRRISDESIGSSTGQPNQVFTFAQIPVLDGEVVEVCELVGRRAVVEWRLLLAELYAGDVSAVNRFEQQLAGEGTEQEFEQDRVRVRRDRNKAVTEVWVRWEFERSLRDAGANDRVYTLDRISGRIEFGDARRGKVPPAGARIIARRYRTGGGRAGNLAARTITQVLGAVGGIESAFNPKPAEGGADAEILRQVATRGPQTVRHRGRAVLPEDFEVMAREASPVVAKARAVPCTDLSGVGTPGHVTLVIIPAGDEPRPWPTFGLRERVRRYIEARADATLIGQINVTGPRYKPIDVHVTLSAIDPADAGSVEQRVRAAIERFLHPLQGGPDDDGWTPGRDVFVSDLAGVIERTSGVDFVAELDLLLDGAPQGASVNIAADETVVAGTIQIFFGSRTEVG